MSTEAYVSKVVEGIGYLIALASIIGFLGLFIGLCMVLCKYKKSGIKLFMISLVIGAITGIFTSVRYFHVN